MWAGLAYSAAMVILGLLLIAAGIVVILLAIFDINGTASLLGRDFDARTIFVLGVAAGVAILWGYGILKFGTKRELRRRRENKRLGELSEKLDKVEAERRSDHRADDE